MLKNKPVIPDKPKNDVDVQADERALNVGKRAIYLIATYSVQEKTWDNNNPLKLFITGNAGTRNSFTLSTLKIQISILLQTVCEGTFFNKCFDKATKHFNIV